MFRQWLMYSSHPPERHPNTKPRLPARLGPFGCLPDLSKHSLHYRILKGGGSRGEGTREVWGTLGKLREEKGIMGITRLPTPWTTPPFRTS